MKKFTNRLINENSPYLLQHANNPVDWYPWNDDALTKAKKENKPIFLSIGYSSCHWCHVMAHESFEDENISSILNENFINIKVDREERPDIDDVYQKVCQLATGNGGWPLSVFLTPDQKPFYVGTYFPKHARYGIPGFGDLLESLSQTYKTKSNEVEKATSEFMNSLIASSGNLVSKENMLKIDRSILKESASNLLQIADPLHGGFGQSPKFPNTSNLLFLLRYYDLSGNTQFLNFVEFTATKMLQGGIHDHVGGGFARYSTDQKWLVPHFEKMLYDNALLVQLYSELFQITKKNKYLKLVNKILNYVIKEMTSHDLSAFYSAQDADSEGEEGKYYVWKKQEIDDILKDKKLSDIFCEYFNITEGGNFEGKNILNITSSLEYFSKKHNMSTIDMENLLDTNLSKLYEIRAKRIPPGLDDKILTSWNALMISAFVSGYKVTNNLKYYMFARNAIQFIESKLKYNNYRLLRTFKNDAGKLNGYLDDYAYYINSLLDFFSIDSDYVYLEKAINYTNSMIEHYWDQKNDNFFFTSDDHENLIVRSKNFYDLAIPSGNSMAAYILLRLYRIINNENYYKKALNIMESCSRAARENPFGFGQLLISIYQYLQEPLEILIFKNKDINNSKNDVSKKTDSELWIDKQYLPNAIISIIDIKNNDNTNKLSSYSLFNQLNKNLKDSSYSYDECVLVCKNFSCSLPLYDLDQLKDYFEKENIIKK
ncbi:MAG: thioredoxin domain-containing protein [Nitrososphaeraceae archaeon]